jgi:hypothetical protein
MSRLYCAHNASAKEIVMSDDVRDVMSAMRSTVEVDGPLAEGASLTEASSTAEFPSLIGPVGRRALLQSIAGGLGVAVLASPASAHVHQAAAAKPAAPTPGARPAAPAAAPSLLFLDKHAFETLAILGDQIVPGSRAAKSAEFLDRLLSVESLDTQKRFMQSLGAFEREARAAHGKPWKALSAAEANTILTAMSSAAASEPTRRAFEFIKGGVAETYYSTQAGMKELGWNGALMFAAPIACG